MSIETNLQSIKQRISKACEKSGRSTDDVLILAVTKFRTSDEINKAISLGITDIGENRVQELMDKYDKVDKVNWHIIGHLQTNKVKYIVDKVCMIHSVDSLKLALEINERCKKIDKVMDILIEVNSGEENKNGIEKTKAIDLILEVSKLENVKIKGLMTMAPLVCSEDHLRKVFSDLRNLSDEIKEKNIKNVEMKYLSMGMSGDFDVAIEEGSNIIRPGRCLFE